MNQGKEGDRYRYSKRLITFQGLRACYKLSCRQLEGFTRALAEWELGLTAPDYTTTCRCVNSLSLT